MLCLQRSIDWLRRRYRKVLALLVFLALLGGIVIPLGAYLRNEYLLYAVRAALQRHDYAQARELLSQVLHRRPNSAWAHFLSARLARRSGDLAEAARHLRACKKLGGLPPEDLQLERLLLQAQQGQLNRECERVLLECIQQQHPDAFLILEALSQGYTKCYQLFQARECLNRMLEQQPDNVYALTRRGWIQECFGKYRKAVDDYRRAVSLAPDNLLARRFLADNLLLHQKKPEEATEHYAFLLQRQPDDPELTAHLAQCWLAQQRLEEARHLLGKALAAHPRDPDLLLARGQVAQEEGQWPQAEDWLRQALAAKPTLQPALYALLLVLHRQGKADQEDECQAWLRGLEADLTQMDQLRQRVRDEPYNPQLRYEVACLLFKIGEDQEGENWLHKALMLDPRHAAARQALATRSTQASHGTAKIQPSQ